MHLSSRRHKVDVLLAFSATVIFFASSQRFGARTELAVAGQRQGDIHYNAAPGVRYVGSKACSRCHATIYRQFRDTAMGRSMALADGSLKLGVPATPFTMYDGKYRRYYQIFRKNSTLVQSGYEVGPDGHEIYRDTQEIAYLMGAGENGISYLVRKGGYLFEAPLSYYTALHSWALSPGYELGDYG